MRRDPNFKLVQLDKDSREYYINYKPKKIYSDQHLAYRKS